MNVWQEKGLELLPDLRETIMAATSPMALWIDLHIELVLAYRAPSRDERLIENIFRYARWSEFEAGDDDDVQTAASLAFYEHLPTDAEVRADLPNRITKEEFSDLKGLFQYFLEPAEFDEFEREFMAGQKPGQP